MSLISIDLFAGLAQIAAILIVVMACYILLRQFKSVIDPRLERAAIGILFSLGVVYCMLFPVALADGVIAEPRSALLTLASLFGGYTVGIATLVVSVAFRAWLGGAGVYAGIVANIVAAGVGFAAYYWLMRRGSSRVATGPRESRYLRVRREEPPKPRHRWRPEP